MLLNEYVMSARSVRVHANTGGTGICEASGASKDVGLTFAIAIVETMDVKENSV